MTNFESQSKSSNSDKVSDELEQVKRHLVINEDRMNDPK